MYMDNNKYIKGIIRKILNEEFERTAAGKEMVPKDIVYHYSDPDNRKSILKNGLEVRIGNEYKNWTRNKKLVPSVFAINGDLKDVIGNVNNAPGEAGIDVWAIYTDSINNRWFIDTNTSDMGIGEHNNIVTFDSIPVNAIRLAYKGKLVNESEMHSDGGKILTVYHGTQKKFVPGIKRSGLIDKTGYGQGWYMVSTDFASALFHAHPDEKKDFVYVFEFEIPITENDRWIGYPYLWKGGKVNDNAMWFALMRKIPKDFIKKIHKVSYDVWLDRKYKKF